ncbi:MAG: hypothetical protein ACREU4_12430, partial [Burkholderiales bacterium]
MKVGLGRSFHRLRPHAFEACLAIADAGGKRGQTEAEDDQERHFHNRGVDGGWHEKTIFAHYWTPRLP